MGGPSSSSSSTTSSNANSESTPANSNDTGVSLNLNTENSNDSLIVTDDSLDASSAKVCNTRRRIHNNTQSSPGKLVKLDGRNLSQRQNNVLVLRKSTAVAAAATSTSNASSSSPNSSNQVGSTTDNVCESTSNASENNNAADGYDSATNSDHNNLKNSCNSESRDSLESCHSLEEDRKVEPLKINLNATVPKITIKPIVKPETESDAKRNSPIPKLTIKSSSSYSDGGSLIVTNNSSHCNSSDKSHTTTTTSTSNEPHILPKLTIRANDAVKQHSIVPKLTIKMDCMTSRNLDDYPASSTSSASSPSPPLSKSSEDAVPQLPLPKLKIKTASDGVPESTLTTVPTVSPSQYHVVASSTATTSPQMPKLTIKNIPKSPFVSSSSSTETCSNEQQQTIPKLTIRQTTNSTNDQLFRTTEDEAKVPKMTIKTSQEHAVIIQHDLSANQIPKMTIKTKQTENNTTFDSSSSSPDRIQKFTIKTSHPSSSREVSTTITQVVPKLTISVNDLTMTSSSSGVTSSNSPTTEKKLTVRQVGTSDNSSPDRVPKLMISRQENSFVSPEKLVPKLTINRSQIAQNSTQCDSPEKIPKLTIKGISETEKIPKLTIKTNDHTHHLISNEQSSSTSSSSSSSDETTTTNNEKVPKITIKQNFLSDGGSPRVPKLRIKPIQTECNQHRESSSKAPENLPESIDLNRKAHFESVPADSNILNEDMQLEDSLDHNPKVFNNISKLPMYIPSSDVVDLTSSPSPGSSPVYTTNRDSENQMPPSVSGGGPSKPNEMLLEILNRSTNRLNTHNIPSATFSTVTMLTDLNDVGEDVEHGVTNGQMASSPKRAPVILDSIEILDTPEGSPNPHCESMNEKHDMKIEKSLPLVSRNNNEIKKNNILKRTTAESTNECDMGVSHAKKFKALTPDGSTMLLNRHKDNSNTSSSSHATGTDIECESSNHFFTTLQNASPPIAATEMKNSDSQMNVAESAIYNFIQSDSNNGTVLNAATLDTSPVKKTRGRPRKDPTKSAKTVEKEKPKPVEIVDKPARASRASLMQRRLATNLVIAQTPDSTPKEKRRSSIRSNKFGVAKSLDEDNDAEHEDYEQKIIFDKIPVLNVPKLPSFMETSQVPPSIYLNNNSRSPSPPNFVDLNSSGINLSPRTPEGQKLDTSLESALTSPSNCTPKSRGRGRGRGGRGSRGGRGRVRGGSRGASTSVNRPRCVGGLKHTPNPQRLKDLFSPERKKQIEMLNVNNRTPSTIQMFEEETRMSADFNTSRQPDFLHNEDTQSSMISCASASIIEASTGADSSTVRKKKAKMEVIAPEGTEYTADMIAEYDWPPPKGCCPAKNRDTFMIQEQIALYLGIKSFKRKYPDLPRRQIDMEERNYLQEKGLVSEKMCDLGITAVWASDVLDIMYSDFYEKYEDYKNYLRQKHLREIEAKQRAAAEHALGKGRGLPARDRALLSTSNWNAMFNKSRKEERRLCLDLQTLVVNVPAPARPERDLERLESGSETTSYPIALVPGQFSENYRHYTAEELRYYPVNTILENPALRNLPVPKLENTLDASSEIESSGSESNSDSDSDSDESSNNSSTDSGTSSSEEEMSTDGVLCCVCHRPQNKNLKGLPEVIIKCYTCRKKTHPSCIEMPHRMVARVRNYNWQCADCKCCIKCKRKQDENKMLFCEQCDRGYHIYCLDIKSVPDGRWNCERCCVCMRCGATKPEGNGAPTTPSPVKQVKHKKVKWINEYRIDHITKLREHSSMLCVPCARLKSTNRKLPLANHLHS